MSDEVPCGRRASHHYIWTKDQEGEICEYHLAWMREVAGALGHHVDLQELGTDHDLECGQMVKPERIAVVFRFPNGMVAVCGDDGQQIPRYQGRFDDVRWAVERDRDDETKFEGVSWPR